MEVVGKITLMFAAIGAIAGAIFAPLVVYVDFPGWPLGFFAGLILFFAIFYVTLRLAPTVLKISPAEFPGGKRKIVAAGFLPFFITWLILWIMVYTILIGS